jgi:hypothetical protein
VTILTDLLGLVRQTCAGLADKRRGKNTHLSMADIGMAAFSAFFTQSPSFLAHQRQLAEGAGHGRSNCQSLFGMTAIPSDNHIRDMLDFVEPSSLDALLDAALAAVERNGGLAPLTSLGGRLLIALDGTEYFCSNKLSCPRCSTRKRANGTIEYFHTMLAASIVTPGHNRALPLPPEVVRPQDGHGKQDCESRAARRWLAAHGARYKRFDPVYLGDDLYSNQPVCEAAVASGGHFLFVCKPDSHKILYEYLDGVEVATQSKAVKRGKQRATHAWRWMNAIPIRGGEGALMVNWLELVIRDASGKITYRNSFATDLPVDANNVEALANAGRARWKIENETFNVLKTKGYNLEHNFGHGKNNLSATLAMLNLIAFAIHTAAGIADLAWRRAVEAAGARTRFFGYMRALTVFVLYTSWNEILDTLAFQPPTAQPP